MTIISSELNEIINLITNNTGHYFKNINENKKIISLNNTIGDLESRDNICEICNIKLSIFIDYSKILYKQNNWNYLSNEKCDYFYIFNSLDFNENISCNEYIIKKLLE